MSKRTLQIHTSKEQIHTLALSKKTYCGQSYRRGRCFICSMTQRLNSTPQRAGDVKSWGQELLDHLLLLLALLKKKKENKKETAAPSPPLAVLHPGERKAPPLLESERDVVEFPLMIASKRLSLNCRLGKELLTSKRAQGIAFTVIPFLK